MKELTITLAAPEWDYIGKLLLQRPYGEVAALVNKLNTQFAAQQQPSAPLPEIKGEPNG